MSESQGIFGYFTSAAQIKPAFDPGLDVSCPICLSPLKNAPRITTSLMAKGDDRSYFFRAHKKCWNTASEKDKLDIESSLIDVVS